MSLDIILASNTMFCAMRSENDSINALFTPLDDARWDELFELVREGLGVAKTAPGWSVADAIEWAAISRHQVDPDREDDTTLRTALPQFPWEDSNHVYFLHAMTGECYRTARDSAADIRIDEIWYPSADVLMILPDPPTVVALIHEDGRISMARLNPA